MIKSADILAKLLANENITVIRTNSKTASFNIKTRILNLPQWKDMTPEVEEMLIVHEVGHALFTTQDGYIKSLEKLNLKGSIFSYANVIEDVRIERKMRELYPGCRKTFFIGYKGLVERDFFNTRDKDLSTYNLIDRINLYYKAGHSCGVRFTDAERKFLWRVEKVETEEEVVQLAKEIYEFSKTEAKTSREKLESLIGVHEDSEDDEDDFSQNSSSDYSEDEELEDETSATVEEESSLKSDGTSAGALDEEQDEELDSKTYASMKSKIEDLADALTQIKYVEPEFHVNRHVSKTIVPYKVIADVIAQHQDKMSIHMRTLLKEASSSTLKSSSNIVSYLIKEFEMKKAASAYKYAKVSKLGQLDSRKLHAYKLKDDIFRQVINTQDGKKHGMLFLLDWSGSMSEYLDETIEQVINLAMFCHRAQIPFQVFAFSDRFFLTDGQEHSYSDYSEPIGHNQHFVSRKENGIGDNTKFNLLEFFSDKMTTSEFMKMSVALTNRTYLPPSQFSLGGTPLNDALVFMTKYIGEFVRNNSVEKMTFVTLTDGESSELKSSRGNLTNGSIGAVINNDFKIMKCRTYLRDPITKKEYEIGKSANTQTDALMSLIKDRYSCKNLGFFVVKNSEKEMARFFRNNISEYNAESILKSRVELRQNGYNVMKNLPGRNEFYMLDSKKLEAKYGDLDKLSSESNSREIAKRFTNLMNTRKTSRVVLNKFIEQIS